MNAGDDVAKGRPVSDVPTQWEAAAAELTPDKSLARVDARAQQVVGTVSIVGTVLTGFGLVAGGLLVPPSAARPVALAAAAAALVAVVLALGASLLRITPALAPGNLVEVEAWYGRQFRRAYPVMAAGWLLLVSVALAAVAAAMLLARGGASEPVVSVARAGVGEQAKLTVRIEFTGVESGELLQAEVTGVRAGAPPQSLARSVTRVGAAGTATAALEAQDVAAYSDARVVATLAGRRCTATLPLARGTATSTCEGP